MTILRPGQGLLYMKVGVHAQESLESILERKMKEFHDEGAIFWGYGGNSCYPSTAVQPFVRTQLQGGNEVFLVMEEIDSHHQEDPVASEEYSTDGRSNWQKIPAGIRVLGSKYALVLDKIEQVDLQFDLAKSRVAVGRKVGRAGSAYIKGRVDKACLEVTEMPVDPEQSIIKRISLYARLKDPYAVFLRGAR